MFVGLGSSQGQSVAFASLLVWQGLPVSCGKKMTLAYGYVLPNRTASIHGHEVPWEAKNAMIKH